MKLSESVIDNMTARVALALAARDERLGGRSDPYDREADAQVAVSAVVAYLHSILVLDPV